MRSRSIVVVSDACDGWPPAAFSRSRADCRSDWHCGVRGPGPSPGVAEEHRGSVAVRGGYLERLPLACVREGLVDTAEIWRHWRASSPPPFDRETPHLARRAFHLDNASAPYSSTDMLGFIDAFGPPHILCVLGLGVDEAILDACAKSVKIYNSIDAPALRVPENVSRHFDLVLTGAEWQSAEIRARHPGMRTAVLPIGPEFASPDQFFPTGEPKVYDVVYVAAAQAYKRHDVLFEAMASPPRTLRALCVCGYGENGDALRRRARELEIDVDFVGPPGVGFEEVNRLMNLARVGVVCGVDDGAPAILTEYMLAGLPVLANEALRCGLQYILPGTGTYAPAHRFRDALDEMLSRSKDFRAREAALDRWVWPRSANTLKTMLLEIQNDETTRK